MKKTIYGVHNLEKLMSTGLANGSIPAARVDHPLRAPLSISRQRSQTIGQRRHQALRRFNRLRKHHSAAKAARIVGASVPTLWRWQQRFDKHGQAGLLPQNHKAGRVSPFARIALAAKAVRELELLVLKLCSPRAAWRQFANQSPLCPPIVASYVQRTGKPR